jgi:hypothetical protein
VNVSPIGSLGRLVACSSSTRAIEALAAADCEFEYNPDAIDDCGPTVFGTVTGTTEFDAEWAFHDWLMGIIGPFSGDVCEWRLD